MPSAHIRGVSQPDPFHIFNSGEAHEGVCVSAWATKVLSAAVCLGDHIAAHSPLREPLSRRL